MAVHPPEGHITKGTSVIVGPDEGRSLWQPMPSRGYVNVNLTPENMPYEDIKMFWVFFPPGLEDWFYAIGKERKPGDPMPEPFDRPDNVQDVMNEMRFLPPRSAE